MILQRGTHRAVRDDDSVVEGIKQGRWHASSVRTRTST
jgi:hypothetical protein